MWKSQLHVRNTRNGIDENDAPYPFSSLPQRPITVEIDPGQLSTEMPELFCQVGIPSSPASSRAKTAKRAANS
jgi:hypothetical protein